jgi:hypothetical protein
MIGYDLVKPGKDYSKLIGHLKATYPTFWHNLDSTWFIRTSRTVVEVRDDLGQYVDANDRVLAVEIDEAAPWASKGFTKTANDWLRQYA